MNQNFSWRDLYAAAMLELDHARLKERIEAARSAVNQRLEELKNDGLNHPQESQAIADALQALAILEKVEIRPSSSSMRMDEAVNPSQGKRV